MEKKYNDVPWEFVGHPRMTHGQPVGYYRDLMGDLRVADKWPTNIKARLTGEPRVTDGRPA